MKTLCTIFSILTILTTASLADEFLKEVSKDFDYSARKLFFAKTSSGEISATNWERDNVRVEVFLSIDAKSENQAEEAFDSIKIDWSNADEKAGVTVKPEKKSLKSVMGFKKTPNVSVFIYLPESVNLNLSSGSGDIEIENLVGNLKSSSGSGEINVVNSSGSLNANTGSGDVSIEKFEGPITTDTGSGNVDAADIEGLVDIDTGSGDVDLEGMISTFKIDTGSGDVNILTASEISSNSIIDTGSGDIELSIYSLDSVSAIISTSSGDITLEIDDRHNVKSSKRSVQINQHSERHKIKLSTGSGDVDLMEVK